MRYTTIDSPVGTLRLVADEAGLRQLEFQEGRSPGPVPSEWREDRRALAPVVRQLEEYFAGRRRVFDLDLAPEGTGFQRRVWERLASDLKPRHLDAIALTIRMDDGYVTLGPGQLYVVPRGTPHQPWSEHGAEALLVEPSATVNTGDTPSELTAERRLVQDGHE